MSGRKGQGGVGSSVERSRGRPSTQGAVRPGPCRTQSRGAHMHGRCYLPVAHRGQIGGGLLLLLRHRDTR